MQPKVAGTDQVKIDMTGQNAQSISPDAPGVSAPVQAHQAQSFSLIDSDSPHDLTTPPAAPKEQTIVELATAADQTPVSLLGALATGAPVLEPVGIFPWAFASPDIEYVFQAQFTQSRVRWILVTMTLFGLWALATGVVGVLGSSGGTWAMPPETWIGSGLVLLVTSAVTLKYESTWRINHGQMWILYLFFYFCFVFRVMLFSIMKYHLSPKEDFDVHEGVTTGFTAGALIAASLLCMGHLACPFWMFSLHHAYAIVFCSSTHLCNIWTIVNCVVIVIVLDIWILHSLREQRISFSDKVMLICTRAEVARRNKEIELMSASFAATEREHALEIDLVEHKMNSYASISRGSTHDLRTLFSAFTTGCRVLEGLHNGKNAAAVIQQKEVLKHMTSAAAVGHEIVQGMGVSAKLLRNEQSAAEMTNCSIKDLLTNAMGCVQLSSRNSNVQYTTQISDELDNLWTDSGAVSRNLLNLLSNANNHTQTGSIQAAAELVHRCSNPFTASDIENPFTSRDTEECIQFTITDTGCGGVADDPSIWQPFVSHGGSTGLGLWVVKKQTENLDGEVGVSENLEAGHGSVFWFQLPYVRAAKDEIKVPASLSVSARPSVGSSCLEPDAKQRADVLLIDDVQLVLELQARELRMNGLTVETALGAAEGLRMMKHSWWGLALCDHNMPGMSGAEVTKELREWETSIKRPAQLIIGLTSNRDENRDACMAAGMQEVWSKPLIVERVYEIIGKPQV